MVPPAYTGSGSPPTNFSISVREGLGARADACKYCRFSMSYAPRGSVYTAVVSRHALIDVAVSLYHLQYSTNRERLPALMRKIATLRLRRRSARLSISQMYLGDIHRGRGVFQGGGGRLQGL